MKKIIEQWAARAKPGEQFSIALDELERSEDLGSDPAVAGVQVQFDVEFLVAVKREAARCSLPTPKTSMEKLREFCEPLGFEITDVQRDRDVVVLRAVRPYRRSE